MALRRDFVFSGKFVNVTFGWNRTRNLETYKIQIQDDLTDGNYPCDGGILAREPSGAAEQSTPINLKIQSDANE
jgi:hypothetical protein